MVAANGAIYVVFTKRSRHVSTRSLRRVCENIENTFRTVRNIVVNRNVVQSRCSVFVRTNIAKSNTPLAVVLLFIRRTEGRSGYPTTFFRGDVLVLRIRCFALNNFWALINSLICLSSSLVSEPCPPIKSTSSSVALFFILENICLEVLMLRWCQ